MLYSEQLGDESTQPQKMDRSKPAITPMSAEAGEQMDTQDKRYEGTNRHRSILGNRHYFSGKMRLYIAVNASKLERKLA